MGPAFVILIWGILLGLFALFWLALAALFVHALKKQKIWLRWCAGVSLALLSFMGLLVLASVAVGIVRSKNPNIVYHHAFGSLPPAGVTNLQSSYWFFGDSGTIYLRFECPSEFFQSLVDSGFQTVDRWTLSAAIDSRKPPAWWNLPDEQETLQLYTRQNAKKTFSSEDEYLFYHPASKTAFYLYYGID